MGNSQCRFLRLPLELRYLIYESCFGHHTVPSILRINRQVYDEVTHFVRKYQHRFAFGISGHGAGFDQFARWCFRIKRHTPRFWRIKHLDLNIYPPSPSRPIEMWYIWKNILDFSKSLASERRIQRLTVQFVENDKSGRATNNIAHNSIRLTFDSNDRSGSHVGQILVTLTRFLTNVNKPRIILPASYITSSRNVDDAGQPWADEIEQLMTGEWVQEDTGLDFELLELKIEVEVPSLKEALGKIESEVRELIWSVRILTAAQI